MTHRPGCHPGPARPVRTSGGCQAPVWFPENLPGTLKSARLAAPLTQRRCRQPGGQVRPSPCLCSKVLGEHSAFPSGLGLRPSRRSQKPSHVPSGLCRPGLALSGGGGAGQPSMPVLMSSESRPRLPLCHRGGNDAPSLCPVFSCGGDGSSSRRPALLGASAGSSFKPLRPAREAGTTQYTSAIEDSVSDTLQGALPGTVLA